MENNELENDYLINKLWSDAINRSIFPSKVPYDKKKEQSKIDTIKNALLVVLAITTTVSASKSIIKKVKLNEEQKKIINELSTPVKDNIHYGNYNVQREEYTWYYDVLGMAKDVLDQSNNYSIDVKLYICYLSMNEYNKLDHMNSLFKQISTIVSNNPEIYSDDILKVAKFTSFTDYLNAKGITLDEYTKLMSDVLKAYAINNIDVQPSIEAFDSLEGGSR